MYRHSCPWSIKTNKNYSSPERSFRKVIWKTRFQSIRLNPDYKICLRHSGPQIRTGYHYSFTSIYPKGQVDKYFSFDSNDIKIDKKIQFLPLFYIKDYENISKIREDILYDICFIGTVHSDRYKIIKKIEEQAKELNLKTYFYFYSPSKILFFFQKYGEQTVSKETDFWIPRKFGLGMSINPHTKASKRMTIFLIYFLVFAGLLLIFL